MIRQLTLLLSILLFSFHANGQQKQLKNDSFEFSNEQLATVNDGPYISIEDDHLLEKKIVNGEVISKNLPLKTFKTTYKPEPSVYQDIKNIAVLSDIHGQYDLAIELLKNNKIIDEKLNWIYGNGHFVIVGDIFDRGPKVNEMLWLIYKLEKQAKQKKGRVHFLLGNHEYMVLRADLRYLHEKYNMTSLLLNQSYSKLYGPQTIMGRWLRSKPTIIKINNNTFVHGGISNEFLSTAYDMENTNKVMRDSIDMSKESLKLTGFYKTYYGTNGPIWYRGLILDNLEDKEISHILKLINSEHIVVGHCSDEKIIQLNDHKIFGVDSSIKKGEYGEILFIEDGNNYYRGTNGKRLELK